MVCGLCGCTVWSERKPRVWKDITGGESLERVFWQQVKAKNWNELVPHLASNYVLVTPEGTLDRDAAIERWKHLEIEDYSLGDFNIQLSGNAYVVAYTLMLRGSLAGQPLPATPLRAVTVWQQQGREWIAIAHSVATAR
jgi:ketosteroid isomerase-like protein